MTHPLSGFIAVEDSARLIRNYRYAVERMMRILGGWIALTPELSAKLLMGRHVWDNAQHADALGRRLPELRAPAHVSEPANPAFIAFVDALEEPERPHQTVERLVGIYRVLKPHLLATYEGHLEEANEVYEPPTRRILARCAEDERRHVTAGRVVLSHLIATPAHGERASAWQARLEALLVASGGVSGRGLPPPVLTSLPAESLSDDGQELIRLERSGARWAVPEDLESAVKTLGDALVARDPAAIRRVFLPGVAPGAAIEAVVLSGLTGCRMVAFSKVGNQRLIKLRLDGARGPVTVSSRWVPTEAGWRAAMLDVVAPDPTRPA
jgi:hypothetical protein